MIRPARRVAEGDRRDGAAPTLDEERALLTQLAVGDEGALEALFVAHAARLHRLAYLQLRSSWAARAVVQDVFVALWSHRASLVLRGSVGAYLTVAVRNRAHTVLREELRRRARDCRWLERGGAAATGEASGAPPDETDDEGSGVVVAGVRARDGLDVRAQVVEALATLPDRQRRVFQLRVEGQMSNAQVCDAIGAVSAKAVERLFSRALHTLRTRLLPTSGAPTPIGAQVRADGSPAHGTPTDSRTDRPAI